MIFFHLSLSTYLDICSNPGWNKVWMSPKINKQASKMTNKTSFNSFLDGTGVKPEADALGLI